MAGFCANPAADAPLVQGLLTSVDCNVQAMSEIGYRAVSAPDSQVALALTTLLTLYVAVLGLRLLMGLAPLRIGDITLTVLKVALVLALATSWPTYQHVVFNTLFHGPEELAVSVMTAIQPAGSLLRGNPFDGLQLAYDQLQLAAAFFARGAPALTSPFTGGAAFAAFSLNTASYIMMLTTLGVVLAAKIVLALLLALGPVFVALLLFDATRGVFEGWMRAALAFAIMPLFATLALVVQLVLIEPHLIALAAMQQTSMANLPAATAVFLLTLISAGVSAAGVVGVAVIALGFKLPWRTAAAVAAERTANASVSNAAPAYAAPFPAAQQRSEPRVASVAAAAAAMDRRDLRLIESEAPRRTIGAAVNQGAGDASARAPLGQTHRRSTQARRAASSARRDK